MSAEAAVLTRTWRVGQRTATLTAPRPRAGQTMHVTIEWDPAPPRKMSAGEWRQYREGRDAALRELSAELGLSFGVIDL